MAMNRSTLGTITLLACNRPPGPEALISRWDYEGSEMFSVVVSFAEDAGSQKIIAYSSSLLHIPSCHCALR